MNRELKKEIYAEIQDKLLGYYKSNGFKLLKSKMLFRKGGAEMYFLESRDDGDNISFTPQFRVTNREVEKVLKLVFPNNLINPVSVQNAGTHMASMLNCNDFHSRKYNNFGQFDFYTYKVFGVADIDEIVNDHLEFMEKVGEPYFDRLSTINSIDQFLSSFVLEGSVGYFLSQNRQEQLVGFFSGRETYSCLCASYLNENNKYEEILERVSQKWSGTLIGKNIKKLNNVLKEEL